MSISALPASTVFQFIVGDFETAWSALAAREGRHLGGGNFMFALLSMILLEFACRICAKDTTNKKLTDLTDALSKIEPRYFTPLPGPCVKTSEFTLPGGNPQCHFLGMMFDLIRNGKVHQYQSPIVTLCDGEVDIDLTGAASGRELTKPGRRRPAKHLRYKLSSSGDLSWYVRTEQLFLDVKRAIEKSRIISSSDIVTDIARPKKKTMARSASYPFDNFTVASLECHLKAGGHVSGRW